MSKVPITLEGYQKLNEEIKRLKQNDRLDVIKAIAYAREFGDLSENAEYQAAKEKQSMIEGRILDLEAIASHANVIDVEKISDQSIKFGATVEIQDEDTDELVTYAIVGEYEADITKHLLSIASPMARALIGKKLDDLVEVDTPRGTKLYTVTNIIYKQIKL